MCGNVFINIKYCYCNPQKLIYNRLGLLYIVYLNEKENIWLLDYIHI